MDNFDKKWRVGAPVDLDGDQGVIVSRFRDLDGVVHFVVETETRLEICTFGDIAVREPETLDDLVPPPVDRSTWTHTSTAGRDFEWNYEYGLIRG